MRLNERIIKILTFLEKYTKTDMVYFAKGSFWWILGKGLYFLITLGVLAVFARFLPKEIYGAYRYLLSMTAILSIFALPGMDTALIRAVAKGYEKTILLTAKTKFKWALIGSSISFAIALWYFFHQNLGLALSLFIVGLFLPLINTFQSFVSFWHGKKRFDIQSKYLIFSTLLASIFLVSAVLLTNNLVLIVLSYFLSFAFFRGLFFFLTLKKIKNQEKDEEIISFGKHLTLIQSATLFSNQIDKIIVWQILGPVAVAIYSFAQLPILRIKELVPIAPLALPKLSQRNIEEIKKSLFEKFLRLFLVAIPATFLFILLIPYLYRFFFPNYLESIIYAQILAIGLITTPFTLISALFVAHKKTKELYLIHFLPPFLKILLFGILIPFFGIWGIVFAVLIAQFFNSSLLFYFFKKSC